MDEDPDDPSFEPGDDPGQKKKTGFKPSSMVDMKPCEDLHRYLVDKFHSSTKSKTVSFEKIDLTTYKPTAKVASFITSEDRLLLWIKTFIVRYFEHLNTMGYRITWQEQESYSCATKSDKIILHIYAVEDNDEDQLITISIFISTGRIMIQGKKFAEWSRDEFPALLSIVNRLESSGNPSSKNISLFLRGLSNFFTKCEGCEAEELNDITTKEDVVHDNEISDVTETSSVDKGTTETLRMSEHIEPLSLTPSRLNTLATLRNTVGNLEAEFTQFKMTHTGNIEQLKDKTVQQDHLLKVQKTTLGGLADDLANNNKLLNEELQKHAALITKLQDENQTLQKKHAKISEDNVAMKRNQSLLEAEVEFLKDQVKALWEKLNVHPPEKAITTDTSSQTTPRVEDDSIICATNKEYENPTSTPACNQWKEDELLVVNLPTSNSFSPLQEPPTKHLENGKQDKLKSANPQHPTTSSASNNNNTRSNEVIFLCDSNGKFLDTRQMFSSKHEVKYIRAPLIEHARSYLQNDVRTPPQVIILHTGTNDLERSNSPEELISNILILITEASTKFPSSKIFFSTLLPRNDIPTPIITSINVQLINSCARLPNVQLIKHDNLFANQLNILHDNKHILKRHIGLFAKNLKDAIHGHIRPRTATSSNAPPIQRTQPNQPASPQGPNTVLQHASYSNAVKNTLPWPYHPQTKPPPIPLATSQLQQRIPPAPHLTAPHQMLPHAAKPLQQQITPAPHQSTPYAYQ